MAGLPIPPADWLEHSRALEAMIVERIDAAGGVISFRDYMQTVLYEPGLGYYSSAAHKFGEEGDFVTAPELSPLFGYSLANFCVTVFNQGCAPHLLEFGAGNGKLCQQLLDRLPEIATYCILEISGELRQRQQRYLESRLDSQSYAKIQWLERLPEHFDGLVVANEVLDAMPVHVLYKHQQWYELGVTRQSGQLVWCQIVDNSKAVERMSQLEVELGGLPENYRTEINMNYQPWLAALADLPGNKACLLVDYGGERSDYYRQTRTGGSLRCYFQHRLHDDPFLYPGLQDITADVEFDAVADAAEAEGFELCGFSTQAGFLLNHGLTDIATELSEGADTLARLKIAQQVKSLTLPSEMGLRFKVLLLSQGLSLQPLREFGSGMLYG